MADQSIAERLRNNPTLQALGALALDAITLGHRTRQAERERLEQNLKLAFPDDWRTLLDTMDRFDRASCSKVSLYIKQMWARGTCQRDETLALFERCPVAFRNHHPLSVIGQPSREVLPKLAEALP